MVRRRPIVPLLAVLAAAVFLFGCGRGNPVSLCIIHTNDVHGHISPERDQGGAAELAGCIEEVEREERAAGVPTLLVDAGDIFMGTPEGGVSEGIADTEIMNSVGYDAMVIGNHEFDHGVAALERLARSASFPFLAANTRNSATGTLPSFLRPFIVKRYGPLTIGVIGVITPETPAIVMPGRTGEIVFGDPVDAVRRSMEALRREGADFIIVLSHCGLEEDRRIAREVPGIGVIIGGHSHTVLKEPVRDARNGTLICQAGSYGRYLGRLSLWIDTASGRVRRYGYELVRLTRGRCPPDRQVAEIVSRWRKRAGAKFDEVLGRCLEDIRNDEGAESLLGDMITDCMRAKTGVDIAFHNSWGIRGELLKGPITYRDVYKVMPFDNTIYTMMLTGRQIRRIVEKSLAPKNGFLQVSGLTVDYDPSAPAGSRIMRISCGGEDLRDGGIYTVATNSYLAKGGDGYSTFLEGRKRRNSGIVDRDAFADCIRAAGTVTGRAFRPSRLIAH